MVNTKEELIEYAVKNDGFRFCFQPVYKIEDSSLVGYEMLARIQVDDKIYMPEEFIEELEKSKYIKDFNRYLLDYALKKSKEWDTHISINITLDSLYDKEFLAKHNGDDNIWLELTERHHHKDIRLEDIKIDCSIVLDDFGTKSNAFILIKHFDVKALKIDYQIIKEIPHNEKALGITKGIIEFAHIMGLKTVAEGVETAKQRDILEELGCNYFQGYLFGKPEKEELIDVLMKKKCGF